MISNTRRSQTIHLAAPTTRHALWYLAFGAMALVTVVSFILFRAGQLPPVNRDASHPSDASLEETFRLHEADFEKLIAMSSVDAKVVRIDPDFTWLDDDARWPRSEAELGFSMERWEQYRELFKRLDLKRGVSRYPDGSTIELIASTEGLATGGSGKGYLYTTKEPTPLYDSLDNVPPTGKYIYKKLKPPHWYLFYYAK